tara:strand:- start:115 stop:531 length:417 start_codon:yes stop_codon:yes gene_type:complete
MIATEITMIKILNNKRVNKNNKRKNQMYKNINELIERQNNVAIFADKTEWLYMKKREDYEKQIISPRTNIKPNEPQEKTTKLIMFFEADKDWVPTEGNIRGIALVSRWVDTLTGEFLETPETNEPPVTMEISTEDLMV